MKYLLHATLFLTSLPAMALTPDEALTFLYSTLSLPDRTDYSEQFYRENVNTSFQAREEMPWGDSIPEREFLHFVLPVRVNNENLDLSRPVFYEELKERVKGMSMKEAILEVNHWCHENVTYKPSDSRTSSPLSSVSQAIGRCGEESVFTVAALRSIGIPARQIYTPRWAHTDDNHAWVEAWADGEWHFLGACEPEAVLDLAWFNAPASRGLLMSTNVAGEYDGPEEVLLKEPLTTRINVTANYAPVGQLPVKVVNPDGTPVKDAKVNFCIYNYAEYYPAVTKLTDENGETSLTSGLGDMIVWVTDGNRFGFAKGTSGSDSPLTVVLDKDGSYKGVTEFDITPPVSATPLPVVTMEQRALNDTRLAREDSIRGAYMATFATPEIADKAAERLGVDREKLNKILMESRGNHRTVLQAIECIDPLRRGKAIDLLINVSEKDRRDIPMSVIYDHVLNAIGYGLDPDDDNYLDDPDFLGMDMESFNKYVLNPRIENEALTPWRSALREIFTEEQLADFRKNPNKIVEWVSENIADAPGENPQHLRMSPAGVAKEKRADLLSKNIFFVALARTAGIPARIDPVTGATQYAGGDFRKPGSSPKWITVNFGNSGVIAPASTPATLKINFTPEGYVVDPKYYSQFSLSRIIDGVPVQLEYPEESTAGNLFVTPQTIEPGQYILTTGQRLADGGVLARSEIFTVEPGEEKVCDLVIRQDDSALSVIGSLNAENIYHDLDSDSDKSILSTTGRGYYVMALVSPGHEPSAHFLNDISAVSKELEECGNKIMVLFEDSVKAARFDSSLFPKLPSTVVKGIDNNGVSRKEIIESLHLKTSSAADGKDAGITTGSSDATVEEIVAEPIVVVADTFNRIVDVYTGYTIGTGERLLSTLRSLKE